MRRFILFTSFIISFSLLRATETEIDSSIAYINRYETRLDPNIVNNPYLPKAAKNGFKPFLLDMNHPVRPFLDDLCTHVRVTQDKQTFKNAGFHIFSYGPRSYVTFATHPAIPGYIVKAYLDTELHEKRNQPSWKWLIQRCEGAKKIREIIQRRKIKHFVVASKWIYCLPPKPSPPKDDRHTRHLALLIATDMNLTSEQKNYHAWHTVITEEHLDELYTIISHAKGSSYRPDNISYTKKGTFAFIDTEYPSQGPDYKSIRGFLSDEMAEYWDKIVKRGGN